MTSSEDTFDYIVVGSGFGGSTSALRLSEKGYKVAVLEKGREFKDSEFPKTNWNIKKFLWAPMIKCFGFQKITWFKEVLILSGTGVGGGSLVFANTLMTPPDAFFNNPVWSHFKDWKETLMPFYNKARYMLGSTENPWTHTADNVLRSVAKDMGQENTVENVQVGVYFGDQKKEVDPYFNGHGPMRKGCTSCAGCMVGCRFNAKNTLVKNYLYFARKFGTKVFPKTYVEKVEFINDEYIVHTRETGAWLFRNKKIYKSKGIVFSGGVLGSVELLLKQKYVTKTLPHLSEKLGGNIRTNSEMLCGVTGPKKLNEGVAISSVMNPDEHTHVEIVKYPDKSDFMKLLTLPYADYARAPFRLFKSLGAMIAHPRKFIKLYFKTPWASNSIIFLVMQTIDSSMSMKLRKFPLTMSTLKQNEDDKVPAFIDKGAEVMKKFTEKIEGVAQSSSVEIIFDKPTTAHILGGAPMGKSPEEGVVDKFFKVHNYPDMYVLDGSIVPCNIGVNPSLTITALTEYAMSHVPKKEGASYHSLDEMVKNPASD